MEEIIFLLVETEEQAKVGGKDTTENDNIFISLWFLLIYIVQYNLQLVFRLSNKTDISQ